MNGTILPKQYFKKHIAKIMALLEITGNEKLKEEIKSEIWDIHTETETELLKNGANNGMDKNISNIG